MEIIQIVGRTASGKTTLIRQYIELNEDNFNKVIIFSPEKYKDRITNIKNFISELKNNRGEKCLVVIDGVDLRSKFSEVLLNIEEIKTYLDIYKTLIYSTYYINLYPWDGSRNYDIKTVYL